MAEKEEKEIGIMSQIRRLSRRLSGNILSADVKDVKAYWLSNSKKNVYHYDNEDQLRIGGIVLNELAEEFGTPLYIYDSNRLVDNYNRYLGSLKNINNFMLCFAVKANPNIAILNIFSRIGTAFDAVSGGEISRCLAAGVDPSKIIFSGCGKSYDEIKYAINVGVNCINVESWEELERIETIAIQFNKVQNISIRINPDINLDGHKFGVPISEALEIYNRAKASPNLRIKGISCHLGSNINQLEPFIEARDKLLNLADELRVESRICVEHINLGGGFAAQIDTNINIPDIPQWVEKLAKPITERGLKLVLEPGSSLVSEAGVLLTKIEYVKTVHKELSGTISPRSGSIIGGNLTTKGNPTIKGSPTSKTFAIVDAGFNDFGRTALYGQQHHILPTTLKASQIPGITSEFKYDIVGPICETSDTFFKDLVLNQKLESGEYLIIADTGAYGSSMSSNYNSRNRAAEVIINDHVPVLVREREKYPDQYKNEKIVPELKLKSLNILEESESQEDLSNNN